MSADSISPIDGRYRKEAEPLAAYFSERAFDEKRAKVELDYLRLLSRLGVAPRSSVPEVKLSMTDLKRTEDRVGHDVKALEIHLRERLVRSGRGDLAPFVHLGLTSEDTNSLAFALLLRSSLSEVLVPSFCSLAEALAGFARRESSTVMLARTHGRPALPTTLGKELAVFAVRIAERTGKLRGLRPLAKFSGAVGTYASFSLLGKRDWPEELSSFVQEMGIDATSYSTQVVPGERLSDILHCVINLNQLMLSLARDLWLYQSFGYIRFERPGKVSSSTMPQKTNPVDLENAEGQTEISTSLLTLLAYRLQVTRLQRDLSDSVLRRMVGQALAHSLVAAGRLRGSLRSMSVDGDAMKADLDAHPEVYAEREQILLRLKGDPRGYERVKKEVEAGKFRPGRKPTDVYLGEAASLATGAPRVVKRLLRPSA